MTCSLKFYNVQPQLETGLPIARDEWKFPLRWLEFAGDTIFMAVVMPGLDDVPKTAWVPDQRDLLANDWMVLDPN